MNSPYCRLLKKRIKGTCNFQGYDVESLMKETSQLRKLITKRGTLEILMPLCCTTNPVRYLKFRNTMKGFSSKTLAIRLKELERNGILSRKAYNEIPPRVEYRLTTKGQELAESIIIYFMDEKMVYELNKFYKNTRNKFDYFSAHMSIFNINELNFRISIALIIFFHLLFKD